LVNPGGIEKTVQKIYDRYKLLISWNYRTSAAWKYSIEYVSKSLPRDFRNAFLDFFGIANIIRACTKDEEDKMRKPVIPTNLAFILLALFQLYIIFANWGGDTLTIIFSFLIFIGCIAILIVSILYKKI